MKLRLITEMDTDIPKCCATLSRLTRLYWHGRGRPGNAAGKPTCDAYAKIMIGGKPFCRKHAGVYILANFTEVS